MNLSEYEVAAWRTANTALSNRDLLTMTGLGIAGEAGECADHIKKHAFHGHSLDVEKVEKELGDVLWYVSVMASAIGSSLETVAMKNVDKLRARYADGFSEEASRNRVV